VQQLDSDNTACEQKQHKLLALSLSELIGQTIKKLLPKGLVKDYIELPLMSRFSRKGANKSKQLYLIHELRHPHNNSSNANNHLIAAECA
jgi:hypothetical protein